MNQDVKLTFIIPVYNGEKYIERCLESIGKYSTVQCVCVDDGSIDNSAKLLDEIKSRQENIEVVHITNQGVSNARNVGMQYAKGEWISFLDVDDTLIDRWEEYIFENISAGINLICFPHVWEYVEGKERLVEFSNKSIPELLLTTPEMNTCWSKLYRRAIIEENSIAFNTSMQYGEDFCFVLDYCKAIDQQSVFLEKRPLVYYRNNVLSVMHANKIDQRLNDNMIMLLNRLQYADEFQYDQLQQKIFQHHFGALTDIMRSIALLGKEKQKNYQIIKAHKYTNFVMDKINSRQLSNLKKIEYFMIKHTFFCIPTYFKMKAYIYKFIG